MNKDFYLDDYSMEDILKKFNLVDANIESEENTEELSDSSDTNEEPQKDKPSFSMKPNFNSKGEKVVVFSIKIPLKSNELKIDILINNEMYKNIGKHFKK
jgi:hypothetical protein